MNLEALVVSKGLAKKATPIWEGSSQVCHTGKRLGEHASNNGSLLRDARDLLAIGCHLSLERIEAQQMIKRCH